MISPSPTVSASTLEQLLRREQQCAEQLLEWMEKEYQLLNQGNIDDLGPLIAAKNEAVGRLQTTSRQREQLLTSHGLAGGVAGIKHCLETLDDSTGLSAQLDQLVEIAERCQTLNNLSGRLVRQRQNLSRNALRILQGRQDLPMDTYTQQGTANAAPRSRTLGKA